MNVTMDETKGEGWQWTVPNILSGSRILAAPLLLWLAWNGEANWFLGLLIYSLLTDILDGKLARWLNQCSDFGTRLDSWADCLTYFSVPFCAWWLRPDFVRSEWICFAVIVTAYVLPVLAGFAKFGRLPSYHTRMAVISAYVVGLATVVMFAHGPIWPLYMAAVCMVITVVEEIYITAILPRPAVNIKSFQVAQQIRSEMLKAEHEDAAEAVIH